MNLKKTLDLQRASENQWIAKAIAAVHRIARDRQQFRADWKRYISIYQITKEKTRKDYGGQVRETAGYPSALRRVRLVQSSIDILITTGAVIPQFAVDKITFLG